MVFLPPDLFVDNAKPCPKCGAVNPESATECQECKAPLEETHGEKNEKE